jgi:hypothetical protein
MHLQIRAEHAVLSCLYLTEVTERLLIIVGHYTSGMHAFGKACLQHALIHMQTRKALCVQAGSELVPFSIAQRQQPALPHHARPHHKGMSS